MASKHTTSIVDVSELEDDEVPLNMNVAGDSGAHHGATGPAEGGRTSASGGVASTNLYLYHEDTHPLQRIPNLLSSITSSHHQHQGHINPAAMVSRDPSPAQTMARLPAIDYRQTSASPCSMDNHHNQLPTGDPRSTTPAPPQQSQPPEESKANLGTLSGVYFPCLQNIFGVILFIRMVWIVGTAGIPTAFALVFICCSVTLTTSISLSAIATNGIVPAGGSYFMISRSLGPECGGAVGTMFFLGTTFAGAMYITGAVEIILNYLAPSWGLFGDFQRDVNIMYHNIRFYGSILLILVGILVWIGVRFVSKLAPVALFCVLFSILGTYLGIFINYNGRHDLMICVLGDRLVTLKNIPYDEPPLVLPELASTLNNASRFTPNELATQYQLRRTKALCTYDKLRYIFCPNIEPKPRTAQQQQTDTYETQDMNDQLLLQQQQADTQNQPATKPLNPYEDLFKKPPNMSNCDAYFRANKDRIHLERAVPGLASGVFKQNLMPRFRQKRNLVSYDDGANTNEANDYNQVFVDITTSFTILISIYFPSCTGILAGSNRSGDLADAQKSIPRGTIAAQLTTSFVYLSCVVLFGCTFNNLFIRDKFGESMGGQLAITQVAWPHPMVILMGGLFSTLGASLQSLVGAPRVLQGIAKDEVIPCFNRFAKLSARGEPETAILFTLAISWLAVLIGNLDFIAPILTLSLVMCYFFINLACTLHSLLGSPNWRPRFKHYHWSVSTLGCLLCLFVMIVSSWLNFLVAIFLASCIYKYIEFSGAEKEWGDGKQGLALSAARYNLLRLKTTEPHAKNWRPQLLLFCKLRMPPNVAPPSDQPMDLNEGAAANIRLAHPKLLTFASQLKAGKGLTLVSAIVEGELKELAPVAQHARHLLQERMQEERVKGFADVLVTPNIMDGLSYQIQTAGLGGLKHNTVIVGWPKRWQRSTTTRSSSSCGYPGGAQGSCAPGAAGGELVPLVGGASGAGSGAGAPLSATGGADGRPGSLRAKLKLQNNQQYQAHQQHRPSKAHLFIELLRSAQVSQNSLLVIKGIESWPESCDRLGGFIDIWWIVNDGGLLMLLPHLLRQHRTWKGCQLRIFTVAQPGDNSAQMREDLSKFLYHLRIEAQVDIVEMNKNEVSDYAYERTLLMEQGSEIIKRLNNNRKHSLVFEREGGEGKCPIRIRLRKLSMSDFDESSSSGAEQYPMWEMSSLPESGSQPAIGPPPPHVAGSNGAPTGQQQQQSPLGTPLQAPPAADQTNSLRPNETNVQRMHTALTLNEAILKRSKSAKLVIINLPGAPKVSSAEAENNYMEFIEIITNKLERVLLVQSSGREVITIHS